MANDEQKPTFVLTESAIRWGTDVLRDQRIHPFFTAYLFLRREAAAQGASTVEPNWSGLEYYLQVPGGPPGKPWFRPFTDHVRNSEQEWMRAHPAGSWNTSSVRPGTPGARVLDIEGTTYTFSDGHWDRAREHLLHDQPVPLIALMTFLYRNFGFQTDGPSLGPVDLLDTFRRDFEYLTDAHHAEFETLYDASLPERTDWFERWTDPENPDEGGNDDDAL